MRGVVVVDADAPAADLVESLMRDRRRTVDLLRGLTDEQWRQPVWDSVQGEVTLLDPANYGRVVAELAAVRSKLGDAGAARRAAENIMEVVKR